MLVVLSRCGYMRCPIAIMTALFIVLLFPLLVLSGNTKPDQPTSANNPMSIDYIPLNVSIAPGGGATSTAYVTNSSNTWYNYQIALTNKDKNITLVVSGIRLFINEVCKSNDLC